MTESTVKLFDAHFHVIDPKFPLWANNGFLPEAFTCKDYINRMDGKQLLGGAVVSGSFQSFDQSYLIEALHKLGPNYVGVTQLPHTVPDDEIVELNAAGVRAIRFNLKRGGKDQIKHLENFASRVYEIAAWHVELYVDSVDLDVIYKKIIKLPSVSIDHLGLSKTGQKLLLELAESGVSVKTTGFGRVDFDVNITLKTIYSVNPDSLMFGTDLPSTRAKRPFYDSDITLISDSLGDKKAVDQVLFENALRFYRLTK